MTKKENEKEEEEGEGIDEIIHETLVCQLDIIYAL